MLPALDVTVISEIQEVFKHPAEAFYLLLMMMTMPEYTNIGLPSISGFGSARSLAKLYDFLANKGSVKAKRLLSPHIVNILTNPMNKSVPNLLLLTQPMSPGLAVNNDIKDQILVTHPGFGGNIAFADTSINVGYAYFTNYLGGYLGDDPREKISNFSKLAEHCKLNDIHALSQSRASSRKTVVLMQTLFSTTGVRVTLQAPRTSGYFHPAFRKVAETFRSNLESGLERGASFAVYHNGEILVDIWGGWADHDTERHWQSDTLSISWSMAKGVSAIVIARLVDMGLLDYKTEVYKYWPEFSENDKENITVEMLMAHQAGLITLDEPIKLEEYRDNWTKVERLLAKQKPKWPAGTAQGYHAFTLGMYADALVRKVDTQHRNLSQFFQEEIAQPLDIEFYIGLPFGEYYKFARPKAASLWEQRFHYTDFYHIMLSPLLSIAASALDVTEKMMTMPEYTNIGFPSISGFGSARSLAKLYDFLANKGSVKAKRLLSPHIVDILMSSVNKSVPNVLLLSHPMSPGLVIYKDKHDHILVGHPGYGGNMAFADSNINIGYAYFTNYLGGYLIDDPRESFWYFPMFLFEIILFLCLFQEIVGSRYPVAI
ncbi:Beta-lactamase domain-containing protein 2 [Bulinus truncatus]|nr:Beta-lactamase domain-containing protein 2 [Bulinus truncatus]